MTVEEWLGKDNTLGIDIWKNKYQFGGETFDHWLDRVSGGDDEVRDLIIQKKFLFGGRILANRGTNQNGRKISLSNCYVIAPPEDNIESIFECATKLARTYSYGGGCGIDIGKLAPKGALIHNAAKETSGAVSFMDLYSTVTGLIGQGGRRGALMISIPCDHPDLEEFIKIKQNTDKVTKANISIRVTDEFMRAVEERKPYTLKFTRESSGEEIVKEIDAHEIFMKMCEANWDWGEPGLLFWDNIEKYNLLSEDNSFKYAGVNPCAEEPLPAGGACLLGSINLSEFVSDDGTEFEYDDFENTVRISVKALNDVLDEGLPLHPLQEQRNSVHDWRQIGLGIFGLADMLIKMDIKYGSPESIKLCDEIGYSMARAAMTTSIDLAQEKGHYPRFNGDAVQKSLFWRSHDMDASFDKDLYKYGLRNSQLLTIAPTGTLSTMLRVSGGIEPIFANYYTRKTESLHGHDQYYKVYTPIVKEYIDTYGLTDDSQLPDFFVTAQTLDYKDRIAMQSIWQKHIDASISSTVNVPQEFSVEKVKDIYMEAWKAGLKGITMFRDGCKRAGILTTHVEEDTHEEEPKELKRGMIIKADDNCIGKKRTLQTGCGTLHCEAFFDPDTGDLLETYLSKGSTGGCNNFMVGLSRMISLSARGGVDINSIVDQLKSSGTCPSYAVRTATMHDTSKGSCCPVAIGNALIDMHNEIMNDLMDDYEEDKKPVKITKPVQLSSTNPKCPQCGGNLVFEGGCNTCKDCGWSKCD